MKICSVCHKISGTDEDHLDCKEKKRIELDNDNLKEKYKWKTTHYHLSEHSPFSLSLPIYIYIYMLFSCSIVFNPLWPHGLQHTRLPYPSQSPGVCSDSCPLSWWCHPTISSSVVPFSSCLQSFPASGSFQMSQFFTSGGQSAGVSAPASVLPMNIQDWFPLEWTSWISLPSKGLSRVFSNTTVQKHPFFSCLYSPTLTSKYDYWKNHSFD